MQRPRVNWLGHSSSAPALLAALYRRTPTNEYVFILGLIVWRSSTATHWLVFENDEPGLFGRVYIVEKVDDPAFNPTVVLHTRLDGDSDESKPISFTD